MLRPIKTCDINKTLQIAASPLVVLTTTSWPRIEKALPAVLEAIVSVSSSGYIEVSIP
ncbi:MAG TPA: hypothetical protein VJM76_04630 [Gammaproteobacteria bacterium]|nr:hypothetical protein [Gammaproteobacteria bacterium]